MQELKPGKDYIGVGVFALIFDEKGRILLALHKPSERKGKDYDNKWSMPGGAIDYGETAVEALVREIKEETNLGISNIEYVSYDDSIRPKEHKHWIGMNFRATAKADDLKNLEPHKISDLKFFSRDEIPQEISDFAEKCIEVTL